MRKHQRIIILNRDNDDSLGEDDASHPRPENDYHHDARVFLNLEVVRIVRDQLPMTCCFVLRVPQTFLPCSFHFFDLIMIDNDKRSAKEHHLHFPNFMSSSKTESYQNI